MPISSHSDPSDGGIVDPATGVKMAVLTDGGLVNPATGVKVVTPASDGTSLGDIAPERQPSAPQHSSFSARRSRSAAPTAGAPRFPDPPSRAGRSPASRPTPGPVHSQIDRAGGKIVGRSHVLTGSRSADVPITTKGGVVQELDAQATVVDAGGISGGLTTTIPRSDVQTALAESEIPPLVLDIRRGDESSSVALTWKRDDLERLLSEATGDQIQLTFDSHRDRERLRRRRGARHAGEGRDHRRGRRRRSGVRRRRIGHADGHRRRRPATPVALAGPSGVHLGDTTAVAATTDDPAIATAMRDAQPPAAAPVDDPAIAARSPATRRPLPPRTSATRPQARRPASTRRPAPAARTSATSPPAPDRRSPTRPTTAPRGAMSAPARQPSAQARRSSSLAQRSLRRRAAAARSRPNRRVLQPGRVQARAPAIAFTPSAARP